MTPTQEAVRDLEQEAGAVARVDLTALSAAVVEVAERAQAQLDDGVTGPALDVDDEADAARVVLEGGVVQPLLGGRSWRMVGCVFLQDQARNFGCLPGTTVARLQFSSRLHGAWVSARGDAAGAMMTQPCRAARCT